MYNYLDKESGADHARKLDEKAFDRATQLDLKAADELLAPEPEKSDTSTSKAL